MEVVNFSRHYIFWCELQLRWTTGTWSVATSFSIVTADVSALVGQLATSGKRLQQLCDIYIYIYIYLASVRTDFVKESNICV